MYKIKKKKATSKIEEISFEFAIKISASCRTRTDDRLITSEVPYQNLAKKALPLNYVQNVCTYRYGFEFKNGTCKESKEAKIWSCSTGIMYT